MDYFHQLRALVGTAKIIVPGVAAAIFNDRYDILLVQRKENGVWELPGGCQELGESICYVSFSEHAGCTVSN